MSKAPSVKGLLPVVGEVVATVRKIDEELVKDEWLNKAWVSENGPRFPTTKEAMVLMHREWQSLIHVIGPTNSKAFRHEDLSEALIQLAAAAVKVAVDVQRIDGRDHTRPPEDEPDESV